MVRSPFLAVRQCLMSDPTGTSVVADEHVAAAPAAAVTTNPDCARLSLKSTVAPSSNSMLDESRKIRSPEYSQVVSFAPGWSARSNSTANPEHPPGRTLRRNPDRGSLVNRIMRRMNPSAAGVSKAFGFASASIYTAAANRGTSGLTTHVLGMGQIAAHCGSSKKPMHSVHFSALMKNAKFFSSIASFGHSFWQAEHPVHRDCWIM
jgi:hypothetical protein